MSFFSGSELTDAEIKAALLKYASDNALVSLKKIRKIKVNNTDYSFGHVYFLETFDQRRKIKEAYCEYTAGRLEDETLGKPPDIWQIQEISTPELFKKHEENIKVPFSESLVECFKCKGIFLFF